ncbi:MAG: hypothetical protein RBG13Loki_0336 [Promethearchaeota archaeon CR_4]|nr:MAG: hypothetical protein RBG13Loki_0336 [Candidatus Lokiarchaeota archaeon CR_4]
MRELSLLSSPVVYLIGKIEVYEFLMQGMISILLVYKDRFSRNSMPTIHLTSSVYGKFSEGNVAIFKTLCARIGATEILLSKKGYHRHFYTLGSGFLVDLSV